MRKKFPYIDKLELVKIICYQANYEQIHVNEVLDRFMSGICSLQERDINFKDLFDIRLDINAYIHDDFNHYCYHFSPKLS